MKEESTYPLFMPSGCLTAEALKKAAFGQLSSVDQQQIDEHLHHCELCHDALDGIKLMDNPGHLDQNIATLKSQISENKKPKTTNPASGEWKTVMFAIAASIALLIGVGFLLNSWFHIPPKTPLLAQHIDTEPGEIPPVPQGRISRKSIQDKSVAKHKQETIEFSESSEKSSISKIVIHKPLAPVKSKTIRSFYNENKKATIHPGQTTDIASTQPIEVYYGGIRISASSELNENALIENDQQKVATEESIAPHAHFFSSYDEMANFKGGDKKFRTWLSKNIHYPEEARQRKIEGTVYLSFIVEANGQISNVQLRRGIGGGCDDESMRAISQMPLWNPALKNGQAVRVLIFMPIRFQIN